MVKDFVVDTNVLLTDPQAINKIGIGRANIPFVVLQELDKHKNSPGEIGANARQFINFLDELRKDGNLIDGIENSSGVVVRVVLTQPDWDQLIPDDQIIKTARQVKATNPETYIISNDVNLRVKADLYGISASKYNAAGKVNSHKDIYTGISLLDVESSTIDMLHACDSIKIDDPSLKPNSFVHLRSTENPNHTGIGKYSDGTVSRLRPPKEAFGVYPKNLEQTCALSLLLDETLPLVTLMGGPGAGKTLLALAASLELIINKGVYDKLIVMRPPIPMGKDIGYLPGLLHEKMMVWLGPIMDNFDAILSDNTKSSFEYLLKTGKIEVSPPTYIRGRSIQKSILLVDEAQSLTSHEVKTIVTRMHESSKLIFTGDIRQIDNPKVSAVDNGFSLMVEAFKNYDVAGHITLQKCERGSLAALASELL